MEQTAQELVEQILKLRSDRRVADLADMYSPDAVIVRHEGAARGAAEIRSFLSGFLTAHGRFDLVSIDALSECDDLIIFDATIETSVGLLQITEVVVLDATGLIRRHVPGLRGLLGPIEDRHTTSARRRPRSCQPSRTRLAVAGSVASVR